MGCDICIVFPEMLPCSGSTQLDWITWDVSHVREKSKDNVAKPPSLENQYPWIPGLTFLAEARRFIVLGRAVRGHDQVLFDEDNGFSKTAKGSMVWYHSMVGGHAPKKHWFFKTWLRLRNFFHQGPHQSCSKSTPESRWEVQKVFHQKNPCPVLVSNPTSKKTPKSEHSDFSRKLLWWRLAICSWFPLLHPLAEPWILSSFFGHVWNHPTNDAIPGFVQGHLLFKSWINSHSGILYFVHMS